MPEYGNDGPYRRTLGERIVDGLILGACMALVLMFMLLALTAALGNSQAEGVKYQKAVACELATPSDPETGRDPVLVAQCFTNEGLPPPQFVEGKG